MRFFLLMAILLGAGCAPPPGLTPLPDPPGDDDDDDLVLPAVPETATFAAVMRGEVDDGDAPSVIATKSEGVFQFLYWDGSGSGAPLCRQRIPFRAEARFGPLTASGCGGCSGTLTIGELLPEPPAEYAGPVDDGCGDDEVATTDLSFLLTGLPTAQGANADFTHFALVTVDELMDEGWVLSPDGISISELVETYTAAGLVATHLAMVRPAGWLGETADLTVVATPWGTQGWLPMFLVYRSADRPTDSDWLPGEVFMTSLWQVKLAEPQLPMRPPGTDMSSD